MREISLTQGQVALVDDCDYEWLIQWKWCAHQGKRKGGRVHWYAVRYHDCGQVTKMQNQILGIDGIVDHIDTDSLNNQRHNLRPATSSQNSANRTKRVGCSSRYKGVYWEAEKQAWKAHIGQNGKKTTIGRFESEEKAAKAYDCAAIEIFGKFARLNFPLSS
jgi:hypothetical protein